MAVTPMTISDTEIEGNLKRVYTDLRKEYLPVSTPLMAQLKKVGKSNSIGAKWGPAGLYFDAVLDGEYNANFSDAGNLPMSSQAPEVQGVVNPKRLYVRRAFDNLLMVGTTSKESVFMSQRRKVANAFGKAMEFTMEESLNGNGRGVKAILSTNGSGGNTTFSAISPWGVASSGQGGLFLRKGMYVAILDTTGATVRGRAFISSVTNSGDTATVVLATAVAGMVTTDIVVGATEADTSLNQAVNGIQNILNFGGAYASLHGISATTYPVTNSLQLTAGTNVGNAAEPSEMDLWTLATRVGAQCGIRPLTDTSSFFWHATYGLQKKFIESYLANTSVTIKGGEKVDINGGYKATMIHGIPFIPNEYAAAGRVALVHKDSFHWFDAADWSAVEYEGSGKIRWIGDKDAFETSFKSYCNVFTSQRNTNGVIEGYTDTDRYTNVR